MYKRQHEDYAALVGDRAWAHGAVGRIARWMVGAANTKFLAIGEDKFAFDDM